MEYSVGDHISGESFKWAGTWPDLPPLPPVMVLSRFLSITAEGQKDNVFLQLKANPND